MKKYFKFFAAAIAFVSFMACSKSDSTTQTDVKNLIVGNWAGAQQLPGLPANPYKFSLVIKADNTVLNIDSSYNNYPTPGTYTYTNDSIKITYSNGTRWNLKFLNNYTTSTGNVYGSQGTNGSVSMQKK